MVSRSYQPIAVPVTVEGQGQLDVTARRSEDGKVLVIQAVNPGDEPVAAKLLLEGFSPTRPVAAVEELSGPLDAINTAAAPLRIVTAMGAWSHELSPGAARRHFAPRSVTVLRLE